MPSRHLFYCNIFYIIFCIWYNTIVTALSGHRRVTGRSVSICSFIMSIMASVVAYYICKWLDGLK